ncbi:MAG: hypothetical protein HXY34_11330 [Candidatus Thorarchaeota archaeon]|nr:hypothetical protein [Candidatus Thorarchaeota archaeon]
MKHGTDRHLTIHYAYICSPTGMTQTNGASHLLVVEDSEANEIHRFFVLDGTLQLGVVQVGSQNTTFDPARALSYYRTVESQLFTLVSKYPSAYKYVPRKTYDYLARPRLLSDLYAGMQEADTSWLVDQFLVRPLSNVGDMVLSKAQREENSETVRRWCLTAPYGPRMLVTQDLRWGDYDRQGWGCQLRVEDLKPVFDGHHRNDLIGYLRQGFPVFIEMVNREDLDALLEWLSVLKSMGLKWSSIVLTLRSHKTLGAVVNRLAEIPDIRFLTAGSTVRSLSTITKRLREVRGEDWASGLVFGSLYPETQLGDSITEILSYLLSRTLAGTPRDLQRIFAGNLMRMLPSAPPFLRATANDECVVAERSLGKAAYDEVLRMLQVLASREQKHVASVAFMISTDSYRVDTSTAVVTVEDAASERASSLVMKSEHDGTLRLVGWTRVLSRGPVSRDSEEMTALLRSITQSGPVLNSPSHLRAFGKSLLEHFRVVDPVEILSTLHFSASRQETSPGMIGLNRSDMEALNVSDDDLVLILEDHTGQWFVGKAFACDVESRTASVHTLDSELVAMSGKHQLDIVRYQGQPIGLRQVVFGYRESAGPTTGETVSLIQLRDGDVVSKLQGFFVARGVKYYPLGQKHGVIFNLTWSRPQLRPGEVGTLTGADVEFRPLPSLSEINVILCLEFNGGRESRISVTSPRSILSRLTRSAGGGLTEQIADHVRGSVSGSEGVAIIGLLLMSLFEVNRCDGRFALINASKDVEKFSVQKAETVQQYLQFSDDMESSEVRTTMVLSVLDALRDSAGPPNMTEVYRSIAEFLEDFGDQRPTLAILVTSGAEAEGDEAASFIHAIGQRNGCRVLVIGVGESFDTQAALKTLQGSCFVVEKASKICLQTIHNAVLSSLEALTASGQPR